MSKSKIPVFTKLTDTGIHKVKVGVWTGMIHVAQQIVRGPDAMLDRKVTLDIGSPIQAVEFALDILMKLVPASTLERPEFKTRLQQLARIASANDTESPVNTPGV